MKRIAYLFQFVSEGAGLLVQVTGKEDVPRFQTSRLIELGVANYTTPVRIYQVRGSKE